LVVIEITPSAYVAHRRKFWRVDALEPLGGAPLVKERRQVIRTVIVDDDRGMRLVARMLAEEEGCLVVGEADTGEAAIRLISRLDPELVIMDHHLPGIDGVETTRRIGRLHPPPAVVAWTCDERPEVVEAFLDAGACSHAIKGDFDALRGALRALQAPAA
jgi:DNA-binding NarL/FixJ family response regulator